MRLFTFIPMLLAATPSTADQTAVDNLHGWWIVSADKNYVTFALDRSVAGPANARVVEAQTIAKNAEDGIKERRYSVQLNCSRHSSRYLRMESFNSADVSLGVSSLPTSTERQIIPKSNGDYIARFACDRRPGELPKYGYPTMLPMRVVADQAFRFIGLGLNVDAAAALAAADAVRAPQTFNDLLNVFVPAERQIYVRAIKTPGAVP